MIDIAPTILEDGLPEPSVVNHLPLANLSEKDDHDPLISSEERF